MSLFPTTECVSDQRLKTFIKRQLVSFLPRLFFVPSKELYGAPIAISESTRESSVPYFFVLGSFGRRFFSVMVDEAADQMYEIPVVAEKAHFQGMTIFQGELYWDFWQRNGQSTFPRQVFSVQRLLRIAGKVIPPEKPWTDVYPVIQSLFDCNGKDICLYPRRWPEKARELANLQKIVCLGTLYCLTFRPKRWFAAAEMATMERTYIPSLRHCFDPLPAHLVTDSRYNFAVPETTSFFMLVKKGRADEWFVFARLENDAVVDMTVRGFSGKPLICMPNDLLVRAFNTVTSSLHAVLFRATHCEDAIECEPVAVRPEKKIPDSVAFIEEVLQRK